MKKGGSPVTRIIVIAVLFSLSLVIFRSNAFSLEIDQMYSDFAAQLQEGKPIVVTSYIGLWYDNNHEPEKNLYWGNLGGQYFLFNNSNGIGKLPDRYRAGSLKNVATNISNAVVDSLKNYKWERVYLLKKDDDPMRIAIFKMTVFPNEFWRSKGVSEPFDIYNVMLAYSNMERSMADMVRHLKQNSACILEGKDLHLDLGKQSRIMGYIGHNIYYGGTCSIDNLQVLPFTSEDKKGLFFLGCQSFKWCTDKFEGPQVANLLFCKTNMAPEGYIMLSLLDGISQGLSSGELVKLCNRVYGIAQGQGPNISLFINGNLKTQGASAYRTPTPAPVISKAPLRPVSPSPTPTETFKPEDIEKLRKAYLTTKNEVKAKQDEFKARYEAAGSDEDRRKIIEESRDYVFETLTEYVLPPWNGTTWDFNGTSRTPGEGKIACGTFVVYTLQDAGFKIPSKMARQPSENIIKNLIGPPPVKRFWNSASMQKVLNWIPSQGEGLYVVGLDIHVGFIINKGGNMTFCHSSYYNPPRMVVNQDVMEKSPLTDSKYRVFGKILDDQMMIKWLKGESFPLTYDYFRKD